jgi:hypothetical protein
MVGLEALGFPVSPNAGLTLEPMPAPNILGLPSYQGEVAEKAQNIQYNEKGDVLFFVVDGNIYNGDGMLIADAGQDAFDRDCQVCFLAGDEVHIIPVPGTCTQFYVLSLHITPSTVPGPQFTSLRIGVLDLTLESDLPVYANVCTPVKGRFLTAWEQFGQFNLDLAPGWVGDAIVGDLTPPVNGDPGPHYLWEGNIDSFTPPLTIRGAVLHLEDHEQYLLMVRASLRLFSYFFSATGIRKYAGPSINGGYGFTWETNTFPPDTLSDVSDNDDSFRGQLTLKRSGSSDIQVVHSAYRSLQFLVAQQVIDLHQIGISYWQFGLTGTGSSLGLSFTPLPNGANPRYYALDTYPVSDPPTDQFGQTIDRPAVSGLQFSPDGTKVYFVKSPNYEYWYPAGSGPNGPTAESNFGYVDVEWEVGDPGTYHHYLPVGSPSETNKLADSQLFMNVGADGVTPTLYMTCHEFDVDTYRKWISTFSDPDNPDPQNFELRALEVENVGTRTEEAPPEYRLLNHRVIESTHLNQMQESICCIDMLLTRDRSTTITVGCQTNWSPGSNPFYNTNGPIDIVTELRIASGVSVTATNMEFRFAPDAVMVIEPGALFLSNNCTFTTACGGTWKGIRVEGTTSNWLQQSAFQGRLYLEPGSIIEYAEVGAWTARELPNGLADPQRFGGRIRTNGAKFVNCRTGVLIERFHRRLPGTSLELNNLSSISNTGFFTTENWIVGGNPYAHVYLYDVNGISVSNSRFANEGYALFAPNDRGWGLVGLDAAFTCTGTDENDHYFQSLSVGVIGSTPDLLERYVVNNMTFKDNVMGIADLACTGSRITRNRFSLLDDDNEVSYGVLLFSSELYTVERNHFGRASGTGAGYVGINFMGSAIQPNQVYDNTYEKLTVGNWVQGQQRRPNVVTHFFTDEAVVQYQQGLPFFGVQGLANNEHLSTPACDLSDPQSASFHPFVLAFQNYDLFVNYNYYDYVGSPEQRPSCVEDQFGVPLTFIGDWFYDLVPSAQSVEFDKEVHCATGILDIEENFQGLMAGSLTSEYHLTADALRSAINTYEGVVDLGQKVDVVEAIRQYPAMPSHELRDVLLAHAPLSDEVLKEIIYRAEPLDPWHLTQVLIANSPLNGWVFQAFDEADVLPVYFRHLVKQAQSGEVGVKRLLELEIVQHQQNQNRLLIRLLDAWASDTIHAAKADSVWALLNADGAGYGAEATYIQQVLHGKYTEASSMAGNLAASPFDPDLFEYGSMLSQAEGEWTGLSGNEEALRRMAFDHSASSSALAWSTLLAIHELDSVPMPELPGKMKSLLPQRSQHASAHIAPVIGVMPNPAFDRIAYSVPMHDGIEQGALEVFDAQGRQVAAIGLNGRRGLIESTVLGWDPGLYLVRLVVDGHVFGSSKFTVLR